jgi:hypothetical protein
MNGPEYALITSKRYGVRAMFVCGYRVHNPTAIYRMWQERRHVFRVLFLFSVSLRHLYIIAAKCGHTVFKCDCSSWMYCSAGFSNVQSREPCVLLSSVSQSREPALNFGVFYVASFYSISLLSYFDILWYSLKSLKWRADRPMPLCAGPSKQ